ncbi:MAG TPA: hypothetical protein VNW97_07950 [Candidatus Saccharimonadales bacterium]|jgi:hypothetical protein|nr:hypothetical protein [Candidatus Saccharimonadales bacterium]
MTIRRFSVFLTLLGSALLAGAGTIPAGAHATVRINQALSSGSAHKDQGWNGVLTSDITSGGKTIAKAGDSVKGKVTYVKPSGRLHAPGQITVRLSSINGETVYSTAVSKKGVGHAKSNTAKIGGGAAGGAIIGGLLGGGKGAAIGAGVGAGAGTGAAAATGKREAVIAGESVLTFTITGSK